MKILSAQDAGLIVNAALRSHQSYWERIRNQEMEIMEGKPPFEPKDLEEKGASWCNNRNYGQGKSHVEQSVGNNVTDILKSIQLMEIEFETFDKKKHKSNIDAFLLDDNLKDIFQEKICGAFAETLTQSDKLKTFLNTAEYNSFLHGYCPITRDPFGWIGLANHITHIAFEDRTKVGNIKIWVSFDVIKADVLLEKLEQLCENKNIKPTLIREEDGGYIIYDNGWIRKGLESALCYQLTQMQLKGKDGQEKMVFNTWDDVKNLIQDNGRTWIEKNVNNIYIAKIFTKECDCFVETYVRMMKSVDFADSEFTTTVDKYLMFQKCYPNTKSTDFIDIVKEYAISSTDYIHDLRGSGKQIAEYSHWFNIKKNAIEDKLLLSGGLILKAPNTLIQQNVALKVIGGMVVLPEDVNFAPNQIKQDLGDHVQSIEMDKQDYDERIFHYRPKPQLTSRPTKDEVQLVGAEISQQAQNRLPFKLIDYSNIFTKSLYDLANLEFDEEKEKEEQECFFERLKEEFSQFDLEITDIKKILSRIKRIHITPVLQNIQAIQQALSIAPNNMARKKLLRMLFLAYGFSRRDINILIQEENYGNQLEMAAIENAAFYNTSEMVFTFGQDHITHLNVHFGKMDRVLTNVKSGDDPVKAYNFINNAITNTAKHVEALKSNPFFNSKYKEFYKMQVVFEKNAQELGKAIEKMQQQIVQQQQDQQQQGQQLSPKDQQALYLDRVKTMDKIHRANLQAQANQERRQKDFEFKQNLLAKKAESEINMAEELAKVKSELEMLQKATKMSNNVPTS